MGTSTDPATAVADAAPATPAAAVPPATPAADAKPAAGTPAVTPPAAAAAKAGEATPPATTDAAKAPATPAATPAPLALKLPEGAAIDQAAVDRIAAFATENKLSQEQAEKLLARENAAVSEQQAAFQTMTRQTWVEAAKADKEIGGEHFTANLQHANAIFKRFGTPEFATWLEETGLGNNVEAVRFALRIHKATAEDAHIPAPAAAGAEGASPLEQLYPTHFTKKS